jgi:hypothetical protein
MLDISKPGNRDQENVSDTIDQFEKKSNGKDEQAFKLAANRTPASWFARSVGCRNRLAAPSGFRLPCYVAAQGATHG